MKLRKRSWAIAILLTVGILASISCSSLMTKAPIMQMSMGARTTLTSSLQFAQEHGWITEDQQRQAMSELFTERFDWQKLWTTVGASLVSVAGSLLAIYFHRGPPTQVVGLPQALIRS